MLTTTNHALWERLKFNSEFSSVEFVPFIFDKPQRTATFFVNHTF